MDEVKTAPAELPPEQEARVDPMAKARAAKAAKKAQEEADLLAKAREGAASRSEGQPVVSSFKGRPVNPFQGDMVEVKVTPWGHAEISTGGEDGFERYASGAVCMMPEQSARSLFNKRWIAPIDPSFEARWLQQNRRELQAAMRAKNRTEERMMSGVGVGQEWRSGLDAGELGFTPTERDLKDIGLG